MKHAELVGVGLAASLVFSGCAAEEKPDPNARQPISSCEAYRTGANVEVAAKLGDSIIRKLNDDASVVLTIAGMGTQTEPITEGRSSGDSTVVVFEDLPAQAFVTGVQMNNLSVDDQAFVRCNADSANTGVTLTPRLLPQTGE